MGILTAALSLAIAGGFASTASATTSGPLNKPQPISHADASPGGANGQCPGGPYCSTRDGSPSLNGNGTGVAAGRPCAGCVGKADNKNPPGQMPNGFDHNNGYECDGNHGVGRSNPAHTGCVPAKPVVSPVVVSPVVVSPVVVSPVVAPGRVLGVVANAPAVVTLAEAAAHPLPLFAAAGEANASGQLAVGGFAASAAFLALGAAFVLRRRNGEV